MARKKTSKKITLAEFRTWLAGVQSMQHEDWHPTKENWAMILDQLDNITETVVTKEVVVQAPMPTVGAHASNPVNNHANNPANPAFNPANPANASLPPAPASSLLSAPPPASPAPKVGKPAGDNGLISVDVPKGDGEYESSFT